MLHPNSYDTDFVAEAGGLFDGDYVLVLFVPFEYDSNSPAATRLRPVGAGPRPAPVAEQTMVGWIDADLFVTGLLEAGPEFSRQAIIDSLNQITYRRRRSDQPDRLEPPAHRGRARCVRPRLRGWECVSYVRIEQGAFVTFLPEPWMCWPGDTDAWSEPTPTDFAVLIPGH